jgi:hypothetical protein
MILKTRAGEYDLDPEGRINFVNAREVVPGVWVWNIPIRPGETGRVHPCGYWHWHVGFRPPGYRRNIEIMDDPCRAPILNPKFHKETTVRFEEPPQRIPPIPYIPVDLDTPIDLKVQSAEVKARGIKTKYAKRWRPDVEE